MNWRLLLLLTAFFLELTGLAIAQVMPAPVPVTVIDDRVNWNTIILAGISLLGTIFTGVMAFKMAQMKNDTRDSARATTASAAATVKTAESVEKIHVAVNSERTAALEEIKKLRDEILALSMAKATLEEKGRVQDIKDATASGKAGVTP